jgi:RNA polymerase sigma factor (sigma-70 family)
VGPGPFACPARGCRWNASSPLATETLSHRDREVLRLRFHDDLLQREIAERVGVSQMQVSRILRDAVQTLQAVAR